MLQNKFGFWVISAIGTGSSLVSELKLQKNKNLSTGKPASVTGLSLSHCLTCTTSHLEIAAPADDDDDDDRNFPLTLCCIRIINYVCFFFIF